MRTIETIYVSLLDEGIAVRRPVLAEKVSEGIYRILDQEYDQDIEKWEFSPGADVICTVLDGSAGPILAAIAHV